MTAQELRAAIDAKAKEAKAYWQECTEKARANEAEIKALEEKLAASG
jgi:hypothetical protein